jgi:hypothetical protein
VIEANTASTCKEDISIVVSMQRVARLIFLIFSRNANPPRVMLRYFFGQVARPKGNWGPLPTGPAMRALRSPYLSGCQKM